MSSSETPSAQKSLKMNRTLTLVLSMVVGVLQAQQAEKEKIDQVLDSWHEAAANARFQDYFDKMRQAKRKVVAWGGGAKGVAFLNFLQIQNEIEYVVDINPHKQGKFIAGTGQEIVAPEFLATYQPDAIIVMNPIYQQEIETAVRSQGLNPEFISAY